MFAYGIGTATSRTDNRVQARGRVVKLLVISFFDVACLLDADCDDIVDLVFDVLLLLIDSFLVRRDAILVQVLHDGYQQLL